MLDIGHIPSRVATDLTGLVSSSDTDFPVVSTAGFVVPCAVLVGHRDAWHDPLVDYAPELVWITQIVDGTTLRAALSDRGISGTAVRSHDGTTGEITVTAVLDQRHWAKLREALGAHGDSHATEGADTLALVQEIEPFKSSPVVSLNTTATTIVLGTATLPAGWTSMTLEIHGAVTLVMAGTTGLKRARIEVRTPTSTVRWATAGTFEDIGGSGTNRYLPIPLTGFRVSAHGDTDVLLTGHVNVGSSGDILVAERALYVVKRRRS